MKVLVVEDYDDIRELMKMIFEMKGCEVVEANNGLEAVSLAEHEHPDLILMDLNLPVMDGWEATRRITRQEATRGIPVVAISDNCKNEWRRRALDCGALDCIPKPLDPAAVDRFIHC